MVVQAYDHFFNVMDGQNANIELITLSTSLCRRLQLSQMSGFNTAGILDDKTTDVLTTYI